MTTTINCTGIWLTLNSTGTQVKNVQTLLNLNGANLAVDGDYGPVTQSAVENYQTEMGLTVDGIVGPETCASLNSISSASQKNNSTNTNDSTSSLDPVTDPTIVKANHTVVISLKGGTNALGFYADTPVPTSQLDHVNLEKLQIESGPPKFYQTYIDYGTFQFKCTIKGDVNKVMDIMKPVINTQINVTPLNMPPFVGIIQGKDYKPTYPSASPNVTQLDITITKISNGKI
jgi:hypothetical protein